MKKKLILFMGGQGCGKGTFAKMLLKEMPQLKIVETGAIFRALPADSLVAKTIAAGNLVSDEMTCGVVGDALDLNSDNLLDGFPRTMSQAKWLVENYSDKFDITVAYLSVPREIMLARIAKRVGEGGGRADDADAAAVKKRLDTFDEMTMPAIEWLRGANGIRFYEIDVSGQVDDNFARIKSALEI